MYLTVKNVGKGRSYDTQANISNLSGDGLLLHAGRFDISNMLPGDVRKVAFTFDVSAQLAEDVATLSLAVGDRDLREFASEKVKIPIESPISVAKEARSAKVTGATALLLPEPESQAKPFGRLNAGATVQVIGQAGAFAKLDLGGSRFGFIQSSELTNANAAPRGAITFEDVYSHAPPTLDIEAAAMATRADKIKITGHALDRERLLDAYVFVGSRKLFYKSNRDGADPKKLSFEFEAPLRPGVNVITVVARETSDTTTRRTLIVRKDGPDGSLLKTPKSDDPILDWTAASDE
jgi:carboxyl-terminal processing protease